MNLRQATNLILQEAEGSALNMQLDKEGQIVLEAIKLYEKFYKTHRELLERLSFPQQSNK